MPAKSPIPPDALHGALFRDGDVQRHILSLHRDFEDSDRIEDCNFVMLRVPPAALEESEWEVSEAVAREYAARSTPFPPIVVDSSGSFIDGGHRHRAAILRGDSLIPVLAPVGSDLDRKWRTGDVRG